MVKKVRFKDIVELTIVINIIMLGLGSATNIFIPINNADYIAFGFMVVLVLLLILGKSNYRKNMLQRLNSPYMLFCLVWLLIGLLTALLNHDVWEKRQPIYLSSLIAIAISFVIDTTCTDIHTFKLYAKAFLVSTFINYMLSLNELLFGIHLTEPRSLFQLTTTYVGFSNQNNYATFLIYSTIIAYIIFSIRDQNKISYRVCFFMIFGLNSILSIITGSATGMIAHFLIIVIFILKVFIEIKENSIFVISAMVIGTYILFTIAVIFGLVSFHGERINYLNNVVPKFRWNFFLGLGPGGSVIENNGWVHNLSFELLFDYGLVVFLLFVRMLITTIRNYRKLLNYELVFTILLMPVIWISSSSALSLHFTWSFVALITLYPILERESRGN